MTTLHTVSEIIEDYGLAPEEAAKLILPAVLGSTEFYTRMKPEIRSSLLSHIAQDLVKRQKDHSIDLKSFTESVEKGLPTTVETVDFIKSTRDYIIHGNFRKISSMLHVTRKEAIAARGVFAEQLADKVDDNPEAIILYFLGEPKGNFNRLKEKHNSHYVEKVNQIADSLWKGLVDVQAMLKFGILPEHIKLISNKMNTEIQQFLEAENSKVDKPNNNEIVGGSGHVKGKINSPDRGFEMNG